VSQAGTRSELNMDPRIRQLLKIGTVIPAHPLALNANRRLDERGKGLSPAIT